MIQDVIEYISRNKIVTPKLIAKDLVMDEDQVFMILNLLGYKGQLAMKKSCHLGICSPKDKINCHKDCM